MLTMLGSSYANVIEEDAEVLSRSGRCTPRYLGCFRDNPAIESETPNDQNRTLHGCTFAFASLVLTSFHRHRARAAAR